MEKDTKDMILAMIIGSLLSWFSLAAVVGFIQIKEYIQANVTFRYLLIIK